MRPSLADVRHWFSTEVISDGQLASYLTVLADDPNWHVFDVADGAVRTLSLLYYPDGGAVDVVLDRIAGGWRPRIP